MAMMEDVLGLILGGGRGTRLYPLTKKRAKPAVPLAGKYRLIDIPISNCLHSGINKIDILTQFNSAPLHRHIFRTYRRDKFTEGWVEILAAEQNFDNAQWYQGTADAVRQQLMEIEAAGTDYVLVLAGDHLYRMDYGDFLAFHVEKDADITLAVQPVSAETAPALGILKRDSDGEIVSFTEKPTPDQLEDLKSLEYSDKPFMASMGIYIFSTELLFELLEAPGDDFGKEIIPAALPNRRVMGFIFDDFWADIGTIRRFYEVNLELASRRPPFDLKAPHRPVYTRARFLPPCEAYGSDLDGVLLGDGCMVYDSEITNSVVGLRAIVGPQAVIRSSVLMGADAYETEEDRERNARLDRPDVGIGEGSVIESAIIDKNARIGRDVCIRHLPDRADQETEDWAVRDGLVIVLKGAAIPDGTVI